VGYLTSIVPSASHDRKRARCVDDDEVCDEVQWGAQSQIVVVEQDVQDRQMRRE
jgi:hypothetical protein